MGAGATSTGAGVALGSPFGPGGRDGGRGGTGRLRLLPAGGAESGRARTGAGGGRLRTGADASSVATGDDFAAVGDDFEPAPDGGAASRARGGTDGGTDVRPAAGRGGEGFFDGFASSAMVLELTPSVKDAKIPRVRP